MNNRKTQRYSCNLISLYTITRREIVRFIRIAPQTLLPPVITMSLYFIVFGQLVGERIGNMHGVSYTEFIAPGLIIMSVITNAYANVSGSFFSARFQRSIEELLVSPTPNSFFLIGFLIGGVARGLMVAIGVTLVAVFFIDFKLYSLTITLLTIILAALFFSLAGFCNALFAKKFDDISIVPTFVLAPMTYLGGVFYSIQLLDPFWQHISKINPILFIVNAFRYGVLGITDTNLFIAFSIIIGFIAVFFVLNLYLLKRGIGLRD